MQETVPLLQVEQVCKSFGSNQVANEISFSMAKGEIGCLLGPSGCGKTTLLRVIAGFEAIDRGQVQIGGKIVSTPNLSVPPEKRSIGMVFQDYALFPHLTAIQNIEFGIRSKAQQIRKEKVLTMLELVGMAEAATKYPHELSGGQQQRVALARALAPEPELLLLDEPFSNLDALLRDRLTVEVRDILKELGTTALMVTHNQHEAFSVADKIGVLFYGTMQQWGNAYDVYHRPASLEVATFVGDGALVTGKVTGPGQVESGLGLLKGNLSLPCESGCEVDLLIRPEDVLHAEDAQVQAKVVHKSFRGPNILYQLELSSGEHCRALVSSHHNHSIGEYIGIVPEVDNLVVFPRKQQVSP
ncbi:ABC transporter ATP-binding protein [Desulforhopalus sp. IMCC35007]|uniref:ABC transporter ATP-binding protein n=1 Tax=Desulforhopalus sp. IMCC35007 TaxID=2569543 RepID=UPI0010ADC060|nr:ABC transporter ATP-binding protein [Desulforhopalus sp. IMCC35007]TKB11366.1 ABC transporter ATP-binding protein [Desulforhopalus sp. IMCC35007]